MWLHRMDVISQSIMSGHKCSINTVGIVLVYACTVCDAMDASYATTD